MLPFKTLLELKREHSLPLFVQISNGIVHLIKSGIIPQNMKLPGSRVLAELLGVHRMTVVAAYEELISQGWIETIASKGTFVNSELPLVKPTVISASKADTLESTAKRAAFHFYSRPHLKRGDSFPEDVLTIDDGIPDVRIAPVQDISRIYKNILSRAYNRKHLSYNSIYGDKQLRQFLVGYLNETRGLTLSLNNIIITRGSQMGIYLAANLLLKEGDNVIVGESNYIAANLTLKDTGANLIRANVDQKGIDTAEVELICKRENIKALYVTPHHHHPTTVTLSAERRVKLLELSKHYGFAILEDDYDYDFHYQSSPLLPLASVDESGQVIYIGALSKIVAPAYRIGYMIAPQDVIEEAGNLRRIIDRQGDTILERVMVEMFKQGYIQRHTKKALKLYRGRRDHFALLLSKQLSKYITFKIPEGGMAFWVGFDKSISMQKLNEKVHSKGLKLPLWTNYDQQNRGHNYIRLGFASLTKEEIEKAIEILKNSVEELLSEA